MRDLIEIESAKIIFRNFSGEKDAFNAEGKRNFHVVLDEAQAEELRELGVNVKIRQPREEGDLPTYHAKVNVSMESKFPPKVWLITGTEGEYNKVQLDSETIDCLDAAEFENVDLILEQYEYKPGQVSLYLKSGYFVIRQDSFASKY